MSRFTAPMAVPKWGQISAYTSDSRVALSICSGLLAVRSSEDGRTHARTEG